ncbi:MAG: 30S ribosomal protein S3 [Eubacteriales bacterium]|nr:30S ribosomal protein S3 [Eubacteriales bacterium]MDY3333142.1 30S ribosomal protein S3 [Gallibacter sp.]
MGQKVSPHGLRVGVIKDWGSKWYADKSKFADYLVEDKDIRTFVKKKLYTAGISKVVIERTEESKVKVIISTGRPGMLIGRSGEGIDQLKKDLGKLTNKTVDIEIIEVKRAELDAQLTAESIAQALEKRVAFRRAMKQAIGRTMKANAKGIKVLVSGRLGGAEIARSESYSEGNVPLHTLRANIDYAFAEADTTYGKLGIKVWINHGEILDKGLTSVIREEKSEGRKNDKQRGKKSGDKRQKRQPRDNKPEIKRAENVRVRPTPKAAEPQVEVSAETPVEAPVEE